MIESMADRSLHVVGTVESCRESIELTGALRPDLVLKAEARPPAPTATSRRPSSRRR
jgi:hypothetical protein